MPVTSSYIIDTTTVALTGAIANARFETLLSVYTSILDRYADNPADLADLRAPEFTDESPRRVASYVADDDAHIRAKVAASIRRVPLTRVIADGVLRYVEENTALLVDPLLN